MKDLSIHKFWFQWWVLEPMPHRYQGMTVSVVLKLHEGRSVQLGKKYLK